MIKRMGADRIYPVYIYLCKTSYVLGSNKRNTLRPKREGVCDWYRLQKRNHKDCAMEQEHVDRIEKINQFPSPCEFDHEILRGKANGPQ